MDPAFQTPGVELQRQSGLSGLHSAASSGVKHLEALCRKATINLQNVETYLSLFDNKHFTLII